jgi:hypothetical protein
MADSDLVDRCLQLVGRLERLEAEKKLLWDEMQTVMDAMTEAEERRVSEQLHGHEAARQILEVHMRQRNAPPVE